MPSKKEIKNNFVVLVTLDGWGVKEKSKQNVFSQAYLPTCNELISSFPVTTLNLTSTPQDYRLEQDLSELGYYILGTGHEDHNYLTRINRTIKNKNFFQNPVLKKALANVLKKNSRLHLWGLLSEEEKYSSFKHLEALLVMAKKEGVKRVYLHIVLDGVDTPKDSGLRNLKRLNKLLSDVGVGEIATLSGRFYAMDRNAFWEERIAKSYKAIVEGEGKKNKDALEAVKESYGKKIYDKELAPTVITEGEKDVKVKEGDSMILFNFRGDRSREMAQALSLSTCEKISKRKYVKDLFLVIFTEYEKNIPAQVAFPIYDKFKSLGERIKEKKLQELRLAEINKYIHLTEIMDGYRKDSNFPKNKLLFSSSKKDQNLALMESTNKIAEKIITQIREKKFDFIAANLANFDISAQENNFSATLKYAELTDKILKKISRNVLSKNGTLIITSAGGGAEDMLNKKKGENKNYNFAPLPLIITNKQLEGRKMSLEDPADNDLSLIKTQNNLSALYYTILKLLGIAKNKEKGKSLI